MTNRQPGYYRVKYRDKWTVAYYHKRKLWYIIKDKHSLIDIEFDEIDEEKINFKEEK